MSDVSLPVSLCKKLPLFLHQFPRHSKQLANFAQEAFLRQCPINNFKFATFIYRLKVRPVYRRFASTQTSFIADVIFGNVVWQTFNNFNQIEKERNDEADSDSHCRTPEQDQFVKKIIGVNI
jgi:hypothetical protein